MPKCENCGKNVGRRVTYVSAEIRKKACSKCKEKLQYQDYSNLCDTIMKNRSR